MPPTRDPKAPTRAERARQTRKRALDRARELFVTDGYAATTMEQIAAAAGVAVQTLYDAGWTVASYKVWLFTTLVRQLLQRPRLPRSAYADLSFAPSLTDA